MITEIYGKNVPQAYVEMLWRLRTRAFIEEDSRNGPVLTCPSPLTLVISCPWERVLFDPVRDANPFFHVMECVWMLAGSNDAEWISQFNRRMMEYADDYILRGAYGWRWQNPTDQLEDVISLLRRDPRSRQAVLSMWDPRFDGSNARSSDRPCNTHIYFRSTNGHLNMLVCNRSNDLVWGMLGANAVHMTFIHEVVARAVGVPIGEYRVVSNNAHLYLEPHGHLRKQTPVPHDPYYDGKVESSPILHHGEHWLDLRADCIDLVYHDRVVNFRTWWAMNVAYPMKRAYLDKENRNEWIEKIEAEDWRVAAKEWAERRSLSSKTDN